MNIIQLHPPIPVQIVKGWKGPSGPAMAIAWFQESIDHHLTWIVLMDDTGQCWEVENPHVRGRTNITWGRPTPEGSRRPRRKNDTRLKTLIEQAIRDKSLSAGTITAQIAAAEEEGWEPMRCGKEGEYIYGYTHLACGQQYLWPEDGHECPAGARLTPGDVGAA